MSEINMELVRAYLLGLLPEEQASVLEDQYFRDPSFLSKVKDEEKNLIDHYLLGRLANEERHQFENRYLKVPALIRLVDEARRQKALAHTSAPFFITGWRLAVAALLILGLTGISLWLISGKYSSKATVAINLSPGLVKAAGAGVIVRLPAVAVPLVLNLELPGEGESLECSIRLSEVAADGAWTNVPLANKPIRSTLASGGQQLEFVLNSALIHEADYVAQALGPDGGILQSYVFHATK